MRLSLPRLWLSMIVGSLTGCSSSKPGVDPARHELTTTQPEAQEQPRDAMTPSKLSALLVPHKREVLLGEPVYITYKLSNHGETALQFAEGGNQRNRFGRFDDYNIKVTSEAGEALAVLDSNPNFGGISWTPKVEAKMSYEHQIFLPHWVVIPSVGAYTISSERSFTIREFAEDPWYGEDGDKVTLRAATQISVLPADEAAMGAIIEALGAEMFGDDEGDSRSQAWQKMGAIDDERVLPWYRKAIASKRYDFVSSALTALGRFRSDDALASIQAAMHVRGPDLAGEFARPELAESSADGLRQQVAHTLSTSPHPGAFALLLEMSTDRYDSVRLTVLHEISRRRPKDARKRIAAFSKDASEMVRGEALRYLSEL